jgi:predicted MFS family arabinose efflux permease
MVASPLVQAAAVSTVVIAVLTDHVGIVHVAIVGLVQGLAAGVANGADLPVLRRLVPVGQLPNAFALLQSRDMAIRFTGPSTGGVLFGLARWFPFVGDAISFLVGALGIMLVRRPLGPDAEQRDARREPLLASVAEGLRFVRSHAYLRYLTIWCALSNAITSGLALLVILLITDRHGDAALVGAVTSLGAVGGLAGAAVSGRIARRVPGRLLVIAVSWMVVASLVGIALVPDPWAIGGLLALIFVFIAPLNVVFGTYEARLIPDALMGRASSAINFGAASIRWLGPLVAGVLASAFGPTAAMLGFAGIQAAVAVSTVLAAGLHVLNMPIDEVTAAR